MKIKCPGDGLILTIKYVPGIEDKFLTCPKCGRKRKISEYINLGDIYSKNNQNDGTDSDNRSIDDGTDSDKTPYDDDSEVSEYKEIKYNSTIGKIVINSTGQTFQLKLGRNVIGRNSPQSTSDFKINCTTRRMSRNHLVIDVVKESLKGMVHYVSLYKAAVNATFIGQMKLEYGDKIPLKDKAVIKLPDVEATFIIPDEDATETDY